MVERRARGELGVGRGEDDDERAVPFVGARAQHRGDPALVGCVGRLVVAEELIVHFVPRYFLL
ncbi:MAG TPA: hypothetical protein VG275_11785 [Solirubrobacteraceae bacterium]|jgi:hypothetical protein|nr:hypothetical protein [Solirubrobacteraceae bacterium]